MDLCVYEEGEEKVMVYVHSEDIILIQFLYFPVK